MLTATPNETPEQFAEKTARRISTATTLTVARALLFDRVAIRGHVFPSEPAWAVTEASKLVFATIGPITRLDLQRALEDEFALQIHM